MAGGICPPRRLDKPYSSKKLQLQISSIAKRLLKGSPRDPLGRRQKTKDDLLKLKECDLRDLRWRIRELRDEYAELKRRWLDQTEYAKKIKGELDSLNLLRDKLEKKVNQLLKKIENLEGRLATQTERVLTLEKENEALSEAVTSRPDLGKVLAQATDAYGEALKSSLPYVAGSIACFAGTYFVVPDDMVLMKAVGYTGGGILGVMGLMKIVPAVASYNAAVGALMAS
jgi:chromosome segregation ATPase